MSTLIELGYVTLLLKRIHNFNTDHQEGWSNIPHMCLKVKHGNGFAWFGINVVKYVNTNWTFQMRQSVIKMITDGLSQLIDLEDIVSDMDRTIESILEIVNEKKTNVLLSNIVKTDSELDNYILRNGKTEERNVLLSMNLTNGVTLEVYDGNLDFDSLSYGGFALEIKTSKGSFPAMLFHRTTILNHCIQADLAKKVTQHALSGYFGGLFDVDIEVEVLKIVERNRRLTK